jgi:hypothetical protein
MRMFVTTCIRSGQTVLGVAPDSGHDYSIFAELYQAGMRPDGILEQTWKRCDGKVFRALTCPAGRTVGLSDTQFAT